MVRINSVNARYSGTVAYTDNTEEHFHCQMEDDKLWSVDATGSHTAEDKIKWAYNNGYIYYARQNLLWRTGLPFLSGTVMNTTEVPVTKTISGVVLRGEVQFSLDDGSSWSSSMTYDSVYGYQWTNDGVISPTNLAEYVDKVETMLLQIMDTATFTVA